MRICTSLASLTVGLIWLTTLTPAVLAQSSSQSSVPIPVAEIGARVGGQYQGDGLSLAATPEGARLRCVFQKLEGQVTPEGLWLVSTVEPKTGEKFGMVAHAVGRAAALAILPPHGTVAVADKLARCVRPGLTEEYSVSVDGVRQDFIVTQRPAGNSPLRVELEVTGAKAEALVNGARLTLDGSGRKIAYSRMHVVDAIGRDLTVRMEETGGERLIVMVQDAGAVYPLRIDPTFSDANWVGMGTSSGLDGEVESAVVDASGNLYGCVAEFVGQNGPPARPIRASLVGQNGAPPRWPRGMMSFSLWTMDCRGIRESVTEWSPHVGVHFQAVLGRKQGVSRAL